MTSSVKINGGVTLGRYKKYIISNITSLASVLLIHKVALWVLYTAIIELLLKLKPLKL